ncbi:hypothetical protein [Sinorhizobium sp. FG01]|nr:hypothetical protein [Sinorhizobium sp. FG01]
MMVNYSKGAVPKVEVARSCRKQTIDLFNQQFSEFFIKLILICAQTDCKHLTFGFHPKGRRLRKTLGFRFINKFGSIFRVEAQYRSERMMSYDWTGERTRRMKMMKYGIGIVLTIGLILAATSWTLQSI